MNTCKLSLGFLEKITLSSKRISDWRGLGYTYNELLKEFASMTNLQIFITKIVLAVEL